MRIYNRIVQSIKTGITDFKLKRNGMSGLHENIMASVSDKEVSAGLERAYSIFKDCSYQEKKAALNRIDDIVLKLNMCSDKKIKNTVETMLRDITSKSDDEAKQICKKAENLLDSVNVMQQKYLPLYNARFPLSNSHNFDAYYKCKKEVIRAINEGRTDDAANAAKYAFFKSSQPRQTYYARKIYDKDKLALPKSFDTYSRYSSLSDFITNYPEEIGLGKYLYYKYFLPLVKIGKTSDMFDGTDLIQRILKKTEKEFGTKVFIDRKDSITHYNLNKIRDELEIWNVISKGKAKLPNVIDTSEHCYTEFIGDNMSAAGCCNSAKSYIRLRGAFDDNSSTLRHEMAHLNDRKPCSDNAKSVIIPENRKAEMREAGLDENDINALATINEDEYKAVWLMGDTKKYSQSFKDEMIEMGLPDFGVILPTHLDYYKQFLEAKLKDKESIRILNKIYDTFGENIDTRDLKLLTSNTNLLKYVDEALKTGKDCKTSSLFEILTNSQIKYIEDTQSQLFNSYLENKITYEEFRSTVNNMYEQAKRMI